MPMTRTYTTLDGVILSERENGVTKTYVSDPQGSVIGVLDESGNELYSATYWPYGEIRTETGTRPAFGFLGALGYMRDFMQLLYVRARYLRTDLGRWMTVDPLWPSEPAYGYANFRPLESADPSGLSSGACFQDCFKFLTGRGMSRFYACSYCKLRCASAVDCSNYPSNPSLERSTDCSQWWADNTRQAEAGFEQICKIICAGLKGPAKRGCVELCKTQGVGVRVHPQFGICDSRILEYRRWKGEVISCSDCCAEACGDVAICLQKCQTGCCCPTENQ